MSIASVTSRHRIKELLLQESEGSAMGTGRSYVPNEDKGEIACTVVPNDSSINKQANQRGVMYNHTIYFSSDPDLAIDSRLQWLDEGNDSILRQVGKTRNTHGQNRLWILRATSDLTDNEEDFQ